MIHFPEVFEVFVSFVKTHETLPVIVGLCVICIPALYFLCKPTQQSQQNPYRIPIYVAGKWGDRDTIGKFIDSLKGDQRFEVVYDWTKVEKKSLDHEELGLYSRNDIDAVKNSRAVIAIVDDPDYAYRGTMCEVGCALGRDTQVVFVLHDLPEKCYTRQNVFFHHPEIEYVNTFSEALQLVYETQ